MWDNASFFMQHNLIWVLKVYDAYSLYINCNIVSITASCRLDGWTWSFTIITTILIIYIGRCGPVCGVTRLICCDVTGCNWRLTIWHRFYYLQRNDISLEKIKIINKERKTIKCANYGWIRISGQENLKFWVRHLGYGFKMGRVISACSQNGQLKIKNWNFV